MARQIDVNLPIRNMGRSQAFWRALGFEFNPRFTNEQGACLVIGENFYTMLLVEDSFRTFRSKAIVDARTQVETLICISRETCEELEGLVKKALAHGGSAPRPMQDHGFMIQHGFDDIDGHGWELVWYTGKPCA